MEFYLVQDLKMIGKVEDFIPYLYDKDQGWIVDQGNILMDRLMGYEDGSIGNTEAMAIIEITKEQAEEFIQEL